ncbi:MAG TPA: hypothetical protein VFC99_03580, partial [Acidimicrobiia bacterium]|nr:hypothetical protein [Acidimicrobiia bacterium]
MHFDVEHVFAASCAEVASLLCDAGFHQALDLPDLSRPEVLVSDADGPVRRLRLRYEYVGGLDPIAKRIVGDRRIAWIQELLLDTDRFVGTLSFSAERDAGRLRGDADVTIAAVDGGNHARRHIRGDLHVRVPVVGATA